MNTLSESAIIPAENVTQDESFKQIVGLFEID